MCERLQFCIWLLPLVSILLHNFNFAFGRRQYDDVFRPVRDGRPNIVLIMTDDQDVMLGSLDHMAKLRRSLLRRGADLANAFVTTPICCPSRSSLLTGMYVHNHHVHSNNLNCSGSHWKQVHEERTFGVYLQNAGYTTGYFGKYLNRYNGRHIPKGWDTWMGLIRNSRFYNYSVNFNGQAIHHGNEYGQDYFTDVITNDSINFVQTHHYHHRRDKKPFLLVLSYPAPHGPEDPAPQYSQHFGPEFDEKMSVFGTSKSHRTPAYNYAPNPDKMWLLRRTGKMEPVHIAFTDLLHRRRLQTLLSVDDGVHRLVSELRRMRLLSNTYIIFTSDHGYHLGQFGLIKGKNMPYDFDLRVPYIIRGPNVPRGITITEPVSNLDLAPTILDMGGVRPPQHMDGRSVLPLLSGRAAPQEFDDKWRDTLLIERGKMPQLARLRERLSTQRDRFSKELRIQRACAQPQYAAPCGRNQVCWGDFFGFLGCFAVFEESVRCRAVDFD